MGEALQKEGIAYFTLDLRGNGLTRTPHGDIPSQQRVYADITEAIGHIKSRFPNSRVFVLGHSLGGALATSWAAQTQPGIDGLLVLAPAMTATAAPVPWTNWIKGPAAWLLMRHRATLRVGDTGYARDRLRQIVDR
ncbi:MAG: alpha/beta fold hydrolase, partial [Mycobacterium leprae]